MQNGSDPNSMNIATASRNITALSTLFRWRQSPEPKSAKQIFDILERQLEKERDQLPLWAPVGIAIGIAAWFLLVNSNWWLAFLTSCAGVILATMLPREGTRVSKAIFWMALLAATGCIIIWLRSWAVAAPVLERPIVTTFYAEIEKKETVLSRDQMRLTLLTQGKQKLPPRVRVNVSIERALPELAPGSVIKLRARLMPPAMAALPGAYNFAQRAWFSGLGATGQLLGDITVVKSATPFLPMTGVRAKLADHVRTQVGGGAGAIAATLATGDRGAISDEDAEAMRRSGLAHLLSISGLHVTAVVGAVYLFVLRFLALFPPLALRWKLPLVAAGFAALAALGYTLMTGAQVPTIRACVAALLVLAALVMGRSAITLRMVAAGAIFVLIFWPESLVGPSFQLSFAAVTAIIALHEHPIMKNLISRREEVWFRRAGRVILSLFLTGLVVELALMPIALYHFHKAGIYGALANIIAIPLTTFLIMPLEALALLLDGLGLGAPIWWLCEKMLSGLLYLAHFVSSRPGAVTMLPTMPLGAYGLIILGGIWICLWRQKWRFFGFLPVAVGAIWMSQTRPPDLYITGDGRHVGVLGDAGELAMLRSRSGDFIRNILLENAGVDGEAVPLESWRNANCNRDSCSFSVTVSDRKWSILATRSGHYIPAMALAAACRRSDIVVSERWLPASCEPRWLKIDRRLLRQTGGMTVDLANQEFITVKERSGHHQWMRFKEPDIRSRDEKAGKAEPDQGSKKPAPVN